MRRDRRPPLLPAVQGKEERVPGGAEALGTPLGICPWVVSAPLMAPVSTPTATGLRLFQPGVSQAATVVSKEKWAVRSDAAQGKGPGTGTAHSHGPAQAHGSHQGRDGPGLRQVS